MLLEHALHHEQGGASGLGGCQGAGEGTNSQLERNGLFWIMFRKIEIMVEKAQSLGQLSSAIKGMRQ